MVNIFCIHYKHSHLNQGRGRLYCYPESIPGKALLFSHGSQALVLVASDSCQQHIPTQDFKHSELF